MGQVRVKVQRIETMDGKGKKGPWIKHKIVGTDHRVYSTFRGIDVFGSLEGGAGALSQGWDLTLDVGELDSYNEYPINSMIAALPPPPGFKPTPQKGPPPIMTRDYVDRAMKRAVVMSVECVKAFRGGVDCIERDLQPAVDFGKAVAITLFKEYLGCPETDPEPDDAEEVGF